MELEEQEIDELNDIFSGMIEDDDEDLKAIRNKSRIDSISLGKIFLICHDYLYDNSKFIENNKLKDKMRKHLEKFNVESLRFCIESYGDGTCWGSYYDGEKIKEFVDKNRKDVTDLVNLFFKIISDEN